jgi:hypothetical protein
MISANEAFPPMAVQRAYGGVAGDMLGNTDIMGVELLEIR